jgi:hypothetical protein
LARSRAPWQAPFGEHQLGLFGGRTRTCRVLERNLSVPPQAAYAEANSVARHFSGSSSPEASVATTRDWKTI